MTYGVDEWVTRVGEVAREGRIRPTIGPICRDCLRLIPRVDDERYGWVSVKWCSCGHTTTLDADIAAHGVCFVRPLSCAPAGE